MGLRGITGSLPCRPKGGARALDDQRLGRKPPALSRPQSLRPTCLHPSLPFPSLLRVGFLESGLKLQDKSWAFSPRPLPTPSPAIQLGGSPPSRHRWPSCAGWSPACWGRIRTGEHSLGGSTHAGEHSLGSTPAWWLSLLQRDRSNHGMTKEIQSRLCLPEFPVPEAKLSTTC